MAYKRLALTKDGKLTFCTSDPENIGKGRCNHVAHQLPSESKEDFLNRASQKEMHYGSYVVDDDYEKVLKAALEEAFPEKLIEDIKQKSNGESWIIAYGYDEEPYCDNGGWGRTEPYPFITSDGLSFIDMYINKCDIYEITDENFVTPFNKNKDKRITNGLFALDRNKKIYKAAYPDVDKYDHVFIKHIPSY